ncbi:MAG TPA: copper resistance CopC family protein [Candidatus Methylacidiphilales bacterium]
MKFIRRLFLIFGFLVSCVSLAEAHAFVDHADPPVGGTVHGSPTVVKIWFTRKLDPASSKIQVFDAKGGEVDRRDVHLDSTDPALLMVSTSRLSPGAYKVTWQAVCTDTHATHGSFTFEVTNP